MASIGEAIIEIKADVKDFTRQIENAAKSASKTDLNIGVKVDTASFKEEAPQYIEKKIKTAQ